MQDRQADFEANLQGIRYLLAGTIGAIIGFLVGVS